MKRTLLAAMATLGLFTPAVAGPGDPPRYAAAFGRAFEPGFTFVEDQAAEGKQAALVTGSFDLRSLGAVSITSGRIVACDPFVSIGDAKPFTQAVPNGDHPVRLAVVHGGGMNTGRIAFARVDFSGNPAVTWKMALVGNQDVSTLKSDEIFGYPVDAGTGSFYDPAAGEAAGKLLKAHEDGWEQWQADGEKNGEDAGGAPNFFLNLPMPPGNIVMFASGWGDGVYASWFGYDANGQVAALVTDFAVINWDRVKA